MVEFLKHFYLMKSLLMVSYKIQIQETLFSVSFGEIIYGA